MAMSNKHLLSAKKWDVSKETKQCSGNVTTENARFEHKLTLSYSLFSCAFSESVLFRSPQVPGVTNETSLSTYNRTAVVYVSKRPYTYVHSLKIQKILERSSVEKSSRALRVKRPIRNIVNQAPNCTDLARASRKKRQKQAIKQGKQCHKYNTGELRLNNANS